MLNYYFDVVYMVPNFI